MPGRILWDVSIPEDLSRLKSNHNQLMNITIKLSKAEESGIKNYLREVDGIEKPSKQDVQVFIEGMVQSIHAPQEAVSDYIRAAEKIRVDTKS